MKILLAIAFPLLSSCVNFTPDETWDNDDIRIWIKEASSLDLDPFWFKETASNSDSTILTYRQEFEKYIESQIERSLYFNDINNFDSASRLNHSQDSLKGIWENFQGGFRFYQFKRNQYPMIIIVDTIHNEVKSITISK